MLLRDSRLKIDRANKHIADLKARVDIFEQSDHATIEVNPETGQKFIKHDFRDKTWDTDIALILGDAVHNLNSALDIAWMRIIERVVPAAVSDYAKFPVYPSRDALKGALTGIKVHIANPALFDLMMSHIKPYNGGNDALWAIHKLDILDKHRLLIPVVSYGSVNDIETENESGETATGGSWGTWRVPPWFVHIPSGLNIKNKGKASISVLFDEGTPTRHLDVPNMLPYYSAVILRVVELLESVL